jgi:23S rRNA (uridine2552-2'-O)-methyltransferase
MELVELAERSADKWLNAGGSLVVKVFQGTGTQEWVRHIRTKFERFKQVKPKASRPESREMYAVGQQYRR